MYAAFILALGSVCNTITGRRRIYMALIVMTLMVPLMTMPFIPKDPNGTLARTLSWIPFYTPFTMMNRVNANPPMFDVIGTLDTCCWPSTAGAFVDGRENIPHRHPAHRPAAENRGNTALAERFQERWTLPPSGTPDPALVC